MDILPLEINNIIFTFITGNIKIFLKSYIINQLDEIYNIILINKNYNNKYLELFKNKKKNLYLFNKYNCYQKEFEKYLFTPENYDKTPILYDALSTGLTLPFARSSFDKFTEETYQDIIDIIKLVPNSIKYRFGQLRCREKITPLYVACTNSNIPNNIIEILLQNKANPKQSIVLNGYQISILADLKNNISDKRFLNITNKFEPYLLHP